MKVVLIVLCIFFSKPFCISACAQQYEIEVLLLNFEKLMQFRQILDDMKKGYEIIAEGYGTIKNIAEGNFSLHDLFLDKLMEASPAIRNYYKIGEVISFQAKIVAEYKQGSKLFRSSPWLLPSEIEYIEQLYAKLFKSSMQSLDDLLTIIAGRHYRMTDDERLARIDRIHEKTKIQLIDLRKINTTTGDIIHERTRQSQFIDVMESLEGIK